MSAAPETPKTTTSAPRRSRLRRILGLVSAAAALTLATSFALASPALADDPSAPAPSATPSASPAPSATPTASPAPSPTPTTTPSPTATPSATATPTATARAAAPKAAAATPAKTVVSFTFDDGNADTVTAAPILNGLGFYGTYYTNSGTIGQPGYQTRTDLSNLYAAGNEIAGHTVNHPDLPTLPTAEAQREICLDRNNLLSWGFPVTDFAYPFADTNATIDGLAQICGYNSARNLGDIQSRFGCSGCEYAETIPPANPYELAALDEADDTWTLADLESTVTNAQTHGGGWVILTFHHICDNTCDSLAVTPELFTQFANWLRTQTSTVADNTSVETVAQVIGGTVKPPVVIPPSTSSANVTNPSLETINATTSLPDCWQEAGYGTNTAAFSTVSPGHTGNVAGKLVMSSYTDGDAKILPTLDLGTCSPSVIPGDTYQLSGWYTATVVTQFEVYLRTTSGAWQYFTASPYFSATSTWTQATWTTPTIPAGYDGISFGLNLFSVGTLTVDDYAITPTSSAPVTTAAVSPATPNGASNWYTTTAPTVSLSTPATGVATTTQYSFDGGSTWVTYASPVTIPSGTSTFSYRSITATQTETTHSIPFSVDLDSPVLTVNYSATTRTYSASATDATSGVASIQVRTGTGAWSTVVSPTTLGAGSAALEFRAVDKAGNVSPSFFQNVGAVTTATVAPAVPNGLAGWYTTPPVVTLSAGTPGAGQVTQYSYDGTTWATYTKAITVPDGTSTLSYRTIGAGITEATHSLSFKVDHTAPAVSASFNSTTRVFSASATDAASGVTIIQSSTNGGAWTAYTAPLAAGAGFVSVAFRATDAAGNTSTPVTVTSGAVITASVSPAAPDGLSGWYVTQPTVSLSAAGLAAGQRLQYSYNGTSWSNYSTGLRLPTGKYIVYYRASGAATAGSITANVDLTNPTVTARLASATRVVTATASDTGSGVAGISWRTLGGAWATYTSGIPVGSAATTLQFQAKDVAGHLSPITTIAVRAGVARAR